MGVNKMNKLSFRARALDASKPMPIYMSEELPDLPEYAAINRAVPQMPSGMEKEEECEHHLQRAMVTGLIIPTPEVINMGDTSVYDRLYPASYKVPRQLIHMQPFTMEHDIPDYDMDAEDELWVNAQMKILDITPLKFEEMMDRLEKNSGHSVVTQSEAKMLLKEDDDLIIAVYDYWLNKRLKTQTPLIPCVKTETHHRGGNNNNNPYLAFRRRTEKMQTRKNRKNDETSFEKMVKLRRDLSRALTLLELIKRRENTKRELCHLTIEVYEKRYQANDFSGQLLAEVSAIKHTRPAFAPLFTNQYGGHNYSSSWAKPSKEDMPPRKEKRQYKRRKPRTGSALPNSVLMPGDVPGSGDDDVIILSPPSPHNEEVSFVFHRNKSCKYQAPISNSGSGNWPWCSREEGGMADKKFRYNLTSVATPQSRCVGFTRRRLGRGGRVLLDRAGPSMDDYWKTVDFTIHDNAKEKEKRLSDCPHYAPAAETTDVFNSNSLSIQVEDLSDPSNNDSLTNVQLNLSELFPSIADIFTEETNGYQSDIESKPSLGKGEDKKEATGGSRRAIPEQKTNYGRTKESLTSLSLKDRLSSTPSSSANSLLKQDKTIPTNLNDVAPKRNTCKVLNNERRENVNGSLLDRWARFETNPKHGWGGARIKRPKLKFSDFSNDQICCSSFKTTNKDYNTINKLSNLNNVEKSENLELTNSSSDNLVTNNIAGVKKISDLSSTTDRIAVSTPQVKESFIQSQKSPPSLVNSLLKPSPASDLRPQGLSNGRVSQLKVPQARVILSNSLVPYNKKGNHQVNSPSQNLTVNNKIISAWVPTDIEEISGEFIAESQIVTDKTKIQHVTKNGIAPTEVT